MSLQEPQQCTNNCSCGKIELLKPMLIRELPLSGLPEMYHLRKVGNPGSYYPCGHPELSESVTPRYVDWDPQSYESFDPDIPPGSRHPETDGTAGIKNTATCTALPPFEELRIVSESRASTFTDRLLPPPVCLLHNLCPPNSIERTCNVLRSFRPLPTLVCIYAYMHLCSQFLSGYGAVQSGRRDETFDNVDPACI